MNKDWIEINGCCLKRYSVQAFKKEYDEYFQEYVLTAHISSMSESSVLRIYGGKSKEDCDSCYEQLKGFVE